MVLFSIRTSKYLYTSVIQNVYLLMVHKNGAIQGESSFRTVYPMTSNLVFDNTLRVTAMVSKGTIQRTYTSVGHLASFPSIS